MPSVIARRKCPDLIFAQPRFDVYNRVQTDEAWAFCYAKQKNVPTAKAAPEGAGDIWTWVGIDADTKLVVSWYVGARDSEAAMTFMDDLAPRLVRNAGEDLWPSPRRSAPL
jgi:hypothetical protein